jgi:hypothetical protein
MPCRTRALKFLQKSKNAAKQGNSGQILGVKVGPTLGWLIFVWGNFKRKIWLGLGA